ncbi:hypothetical protein DOTSEDRAFT_29699 [Dothistroma septosporum NZE10]|uniref:Uncharacterized protein n=1 Tax=Dothistroma septosporum (strain NZE10 / CBS 128990) TaxID=675120 RepID=M2XZJ5_DOTSN|nr:hypothetical protein DOTSEDRAFT_29699 [Dothistroma septosporum NZE10]
MPIKPDLLIWTDASRHNGTGASGCAVVFGGGLWEDFGGFAVSLGMLSSADVAEGYGHIYALRFALWLHETYCLPREKRLFNKVVIVTDSQHNSRDYDYLRYGAESASATPSDTTKVVVDLIKQLEKKSVGVEITWERRNSSLGNIEADRLAGVASCKAGQGYGVQQWVEEMAVKQK